MATTYSELVTQIRNYTEVDSNVLSDTIVNDFIEHAENRIFRDVDLDVFKSHQSANLTAVTIRTVHIWPASGTANRTFLEKKDLSYMNEYWPDRTSTGTPRYWAWWDHNTIYVAPTPDVAYNVELSITRLPTRLSSTNTTSWLGNNSPALLLYGCLAEAFKFLKGPAEMLQLYEQSYQRALQELVIEQQGRHRRDEYMHGALRTPLQSQNP